MQIGGWIVQRGSSLVLLAAGLCTGCSGASLVLKAPIDSQCQARGLRGCPEIVDGMLLYVDGDKAGAVQKLAVGAAQNSPSDLGQLAKALDELKSVPGAEEYLASISEALNLMVEKARATPGAAEKVATQPDGTPPVERAGEGVLTADTDPKQVLDTVVTDLDIGPKAAWCAEVSGETATCRSVQRGPMFITDVESLGTDCLGQFLAIAQGRQVRYVLNGPFHLHGARLLVREDEALIVGQREGAVVPEVSLASPTKSKAKTDTKKSEHPDSEKLTDAVVLEETDPRRQCKLLVTGFRPYGGKAPKSRESD